AGRGGGRRDAGSMIVGAGKRAVRSRHVARERRDAPGELGAVLVDAGVDDGNRHAAAGVPGTPGRRGVVRERAVGAAEFRRVERGGNGRRRRHAGRGGGGRLCRCGGGGGRRGGSWRRSRRGGWRADRPAAAPAPATRGGEDEGQERTAPGKPRPELGT